MKSKVSSLSISLARIVANTTKYSHITPVRKSLHWLPIMHRSVFKTALLVYKFLHSGHPKYFEPFIKPRHSVYRTCRSQSEGVLLEVPHFASIYKSKKHFIALIHLTYQTIAICRRQPVPPNERKRRPGFHPRQDRYTTLHSPGGLVPASLARGT